MQCAAAQPALFRQGPAPGFTAEQAGQGKASYAQSCAQCHGEQLSGAVGPALKGDSFRRDWHDEAPLTLMSYIQSQMPPSAAGSLSASSVANIAAFLLQQNGYTPGAQSLAFTVGAGPREFNMGPRNQDARYTAAMAERTEQLAGVTPVTDATLRNPAEGDWLMWRRAYDGLGHSPLRQIDRSNISSLRALWSWALPISPDETTPLVHDGVLFIKSADTVEALDAASGSLLWSYRRPLPEALQGGRADIVKSLAIYQNRLFVPTPDGHLIALDVRNGHVLWDQPVLNPLAMAHHLRIDGGPLVVHGKVMVGTSGCYTYHGGCFILAVDAKDGKTVWRFDTLARPGQPGGDSWNGAPAEHRYGGSVWTSGSYDPDSNLVYFGIGQTYDTATLLQAPSNKGGSADGLYTDSTVALDPDSGKLVWYYQHFNRDVWDFDWAFEQSLLSLPINGKPKKLLVTGGKIAIFDAIDSSTGHYEFSRDLGLQNLVASIDPRTGRKIIDPRFTPQANQAKLICPHAGGARSWPATSYDPASGLLFIPLIESCMQFTWTPRTPAETAEGGSDLHWVLQPRPDSDGNFGRLEAIDLATGRVAWTRRQRAPETASVLTTAGGLVFDGTRDRRFTASDASTGKILWQTRLNAVPSSTPITFSAHGQQLVAVVAGGGGAHEATWPVLTPEIDNPTNATTLWVFGLPQDSDEPIAQAAQTPTR